MAEVLLAKLISGEEIIGKVKENNDNNYVIESVRLMMMNQTPDGQMVAGMIPWMIGAPEAAITLDKSMISGTVKMVPKQLEDGYLQQTSGIQLAGANGMNIT